VVGGPPDAAGQSVGAASPGTFTGKDGQDVRLGSETESTVPVACSVAVGRYERRHAGAMALVVIPTAVWAILDIAFKVWVITVHSTVHDADRDAFALCDRLRLVRPKKPQVPHIVSGAIRQCFGRSAKDCDN
jgi:hypothetical protein